MKPIKVACIGLSSISEPRGGPDFVVREVSRRLLSYNVKTIVYPNDCLQKRKVNGILELPVPSLRIPVFGFLSYSFIASLKASLSDVSIVHYQTLISALFSFIPKLFGKEVIVTCHGLSFIWTHHIPHIYVKKIVDILYSISLLYNNRLIAVSKSLYDYFNKKGKEVVYIPNGVTMPSFKKNKVRKKSILFCSRLVPEKGVHQLIKVFQSIRSDYKLNICGKSDNTDSYVCKLKKMALNNKNVIFHGFVIDKRKQKLFSSASIFVLPSETEGMSIALLEAMSYGIPVLVSDIKENKDIVLHNGSYFKVNDEESLGKTLEHMLRSHEEIRKRAERARSFVAKNFNWDIIALKYLDVYKQILS